MVDKISNLERFEHNRYREREKKYLPLFPESLQEFRRLAQPIEQFYLSHPDEPFSLRFRETLDHEGNLTYSAALKDRGELTLDGLDRLEVEVDISADLYGFYKTDEAPLIRKLRYHAHPDIVVDYYEDGHTHLESENDFAMRKFMDDHGDSFVDVTGDRIVDNEWRAHLAYRTRHDGAEALTIPPEISVDSAAHTLLGLSRAKSPVVAQICGRSGSGKSTIVHELQDTLHEHGVESIVLSTDDYHRGSTWLNAYNNGEEWSEWDHPIVYDTATAKTDLAKLLAGSSIDRRTIDFTVCEPVITGAIRPAPVILLEGIYAGTKEFDALSELRINIPTPLATCIGRRLLRDMRDRPEFADPAKSFRYMLEQAEPMWRGQSDA